MNRYICTTIHVCVFHIHGSTRSTRLNSLPIELHTHTEMCKRVQHKDLLHFHLINTVIHATMICIYGQQTFVFNIKTLVLTAFHIKLHIQSSVDIQYFRWNAKQVARQKSKHWDTNPNSSTCPHTTQRNFDSILYLCIHKPGEIKYKVGLASSRAMKTSLILSFYMEITLLSSN